MMEDLLKIKLEMEQARKYVPLVGLDEDDVIAASKEEGKTLLEFQAMENTDEFIMQCENLMKEAIILLSRNNIPYDVIRLTSSVGILCTSELIEFLKNKYEELYNGNDMIDCHRIIFENIGKSRFGSRPVLLIDTSRISGFHGFDGSIFAFTASQ